MCCKCIVCCWNTQSNLKAGGRTWSKLELLIDQITQHIALSNKILSQMWTSLEYQGIAFRRDVGDNTSELLNI